MQDRLLSKVKDFGYIERQFGRTFHAGLDFLRNAVITCTTETYAGAYLEFVHYWHNFILQRFIRDLPAPKINLVAH